MITKIENWLRKIFADEYAKVTRTIEGIETSLEHERQATHSFISAHIQAGLNEFNAEAKRLLQDFEQKLVAEASLVVAEKNELIKELHEKVKSLEHTASKITHWKSDTVETDNKLKVTK
jgi:hypothetical protein